MSQNVDLRAIAERRVVYRMPGMSEVTVRRDFTYRAADGSAQPLDVYYPPAPAGPQPAVLVVTGYADAGVHRIFGRYAKDIGSNVSWCELLAASGMIAVTYVNTDPAADAVAVLEHVIANGAPIGIDASRIGVWSSSGNVPNALSLLMRRHAVVKCAALLYGVMLDLDGSNAVAELAQTIRFVTPAAGRTPADLPPDLPLCIARAGRDETPRLNETIDRFVAHALAHNLPMMVLNHHTGPHAFDAVDDSDASRDVVRRVLAFLRDRL